MFWSNNYKPFDNNYITNTTYHFTSTHTHVYHLMRDTLTLEIKLDKMYIESWTQIENRLKQFRLESLQQINVYLWRWPTKNISVNLWRIFFVFHCIFFWSFTIAACNSETCRSNAADSLHQLCAGHLKLEVSELLHWQYRRRFGIQ